MTSLNNRLLKLESRVQRTRGVTGIKLRLVGTGTIDPPSRYRLSCGGLVEILECLEGESTTDFEARVDSRMRALRPRARGDFVPLVVPVSD